VHVVEQALQGDARPALVGYVTAGIRPDWVDLVAAIAEAGADAVEIGLPFSDPMLDGATVQQASDRALRLGATPDGVLAGVERVRDRLGVPAVVMTYANLVVRHGAAAFCRRLAAAGVDGLIVPDLPLDEATDLAEAAEREGIALVLLVSPSTPPARRRAICRRSRGFVYAVATMGTTGERAALDPAAAAVAAGARTDGDLPVLLGFGISTPAQAALAAGAADGVVIGSALMRRVLDGATPADLAAYLGEVRVALDHQRQEPDARPAAAQVPDHRR